MNSSERVWETIEEMSGNFLGFRYVIKKVGLMWRVEAIYPRKDRPVKIGEMADSPGEALTAMAKAVFDASPVR